MRLIAFQTDHFTTHFIRDSFSGRPFVPAQQINVSEVQRIKAGDLLFTDSFPGTGETIAPSRKRLIGGNTAFQNGPLLLLDAAFDVLHGVPFAQPIQAEIPRCAGWPHRQVFAVGIPGNCVSLFLQQVEKIGKRKAITDHQIDLIPEHSREGRLSLLLGLPYRIVFTLALGVNHLQVVLRTQLI